MFKFARKRLGHVPTDITSTAFVRAPVHAERRDLLDQIGKFLLDHELDITPGNLTLACSVFSGCNPLLSRQILARQIANKPVTQGWLDGLTSGDAPGSDKVFAAVLETQVFAARKASEPLSVAFCNIDRLTALNDIHGQDTGDRVLQAIARALHRISSQNCHLTSHGGEDFAVLFRGLKPHEAGELLNHARENFAARKLVDRKTHMAIGNVTFSGGVADVLAYGDPQAALKAADKALYAAKEQGRDRVVVTCQSA